MTSISTTLLSAIAANRAMFFALVESLEQSAACSIDILELQGAIDADYAGRQLLTTKEANGLLMKVAKAPTKG